MGFFDFHSNRGKDKTKEKRLSDLLKENLHGAVRDGFLKELLNHKLVIGTKQKLPNLIDSSSSATYLTSVSPDGKGSALMSFISEEGLFKRNKAAFPAQFDIYAIILLLESCDFNGLILNHDSGWCFLGKDELIKAAANGLS